MSTMRVLADLDLCQGHQLCQGEAPDVFGFDEDADVVVVLEEHPDPSRRADVAQAVKYCPAFALSVEDGAIGAIEEEDRP
ncbi:ferredoxin [Nocardioides abyssi]|uniref:Ferredoxin n=1 Tax=Nocardioides abyssi TaxID=3058370 RepID=A0ABT8EZ19_9ACTN|nr:ferredoxin [Nocardioides abyssi]MDN4163430.1 ferredoxin [Nocardioides abyssi]